MTPNGPHCAKCPYVQIGNGWMVSDGVMSHGVMIVGEALGAHEAKQSKALVGPSGFLLGRQMGKRRWKRDTFRYANVLSCQPPKNKIRDKKGYYLPEAAAALAYCPYLDEEIDAWKPKVIVALGETAFEKLTGEKLPISAARGYVFRERRGRAWVIPTFHPAFILRGMNHLAMVLGWDVEKAVRIAALPQWEPEKLFIFTDPPVGEWEGMVRQMVDATAPLATDVETPYKAKHADDEDEALEDEDESWTIDRVSFATGKMVGVSVPWRMPYIPGIETLIRSRLSGEGKIVIWNRSYDRPRIEKALGLTIPIHHTRDTMDAWHVLYNALPKKLGFATSCLSVNDGVQAWKHLSSLEAEFYSAMDAVMLWRNDQEILRLLEETGQAACYRDFCLDLDPVLEQMSLAGVVIDEAARGALAMEIETRMAGLLNKMQEVVPREVKPLKVWKSRKAAEKGRELLEMTGEEFEELATEKAEKTCGRCGAHPITKAHVTKKTIQADEVNDGLWQCDGEGIQGDLEGH